MEQGPSKDNDSLEGDSSRLPSLPPADVKRRAARRRFLRSGAAALPLIVSATAVRAQGAPVGISVCESTIGRALTPFEIENAPPPGPSLVCDF